MSEELPNPLFRTESLPINKYTFMRFSSSSMSDSVNNSTDDVDISMATNNLQTTNLDDSIESPYSTWTVSNDDSHISESFDDWSELENSDDILYKSSLTGNICGNAFDFVESVVICSSLIFVGMYIGNTIHLL